MSTDLYFDGASDETLAYSTHFADGDYRGCHGEIGDTCHPFADDDPNHSSLTCYLRSYDPEPPVVTRTFADWARITRLYW